MSFSLLVINQVMYEENLKELPGLGSLETSFDESFLYNLEVERQTSGHDLNSYVKYNQ